MIYKPTAVMGVYQHLTEDTYYVRDLRTGQMLPTSFTSFGDAVIAQTKLEKPEQAHPASVLYVATPRQVENLTAEVCAWDALLNHPMLNAPEVRV